jgi:ATP-dependent helicase/nuclease subunit B
VLDAGGILKTEVLSFQRMAFRIFNEAGGITYPHIHPAGKSMIIYRILDKLRGSFKVFSRSSEREGFVQTVASLITEFKRYSVTSEHLVKASQELGEDKPLGQKLLELNLIYTEFEKTLAQRYRDSDDDLTLATQKLSESSLYRDAEIWIDGFNSFTPQEYVMVTELVKVAKTVTVSLCADTLETSASVNEMDVFMPVKNAFKKLYKMAENHGIKIEEPVHVNGNTPSRFMDSPELAHLERNLYAYPYKAYAGKTKDVSLFSAVNIFSEIESAARDIIRQCRDNNMRFRDIAVVTRNLASYEKLIEVIFSEYGIPCFIDSKLDVSNHPLVRMILSMLDIFNENWSYESVFRYLKSGLTDIKRPDIDNLENYVLACGIRGSMWTNEKEWRMSPDLIPDEKALEAQSSMLYEVNLIRKAVSAPLIGFRRRTKGRRTAAEFCSAIYDFMLGLGIPDRIEKSIENFRNTGNLVLANEYSQVWNIVMEVFDQLVEVMDDEAVSLERFSKVLKIGLGEYKIGLIPASLDQVLVGSAERSKSHEIKAMYILGVNDGVFPSASAKEGVLSDQDRVALNHIGLALASDTRTQAFDEQLMVYRTLTAAGHFLRLSWPIADSEGKTMRPSVIISRLRKLYPDIDEKSNILPAKTNEEELELITGGKPAFRSMISALRQKADGRNIQPVWESVYQWFSEEEDWKQSIETARSAFQYKNLAQQIKGEKIRALYGDPAISSVSRLEKYTACPFAFYVQYGLGAKERKIYRLSPPDIGTFMHAVIERFSKLVAKGEITWRSFDRDWCREKVSEIVDEMLQKMQGSGIAASTRYTALTSRLKRVVARAVWLISEHIRRSSFNPIDYEVGFGDKEKYPPITIELETGEKIQLTGRIDRVDALKTEDGTYLRIIDYKSGSKDFLLSDVFYGLQIQLITYLDAIWESGSKASDVDVHPGGMLYFKIDDPIIKGNGKISEEEIENIIMRQLKMRGLVLADVKLIKAMDNTIDGPSMIIPATVNKGDVLGKNTSGATLDQFKLLRVYVRKLLKDLCTEIMRGNVNIRPYKKKGSTSCQYCSFLSVCQFDSTMKDNSYKLLYDKENDEVWDLMKVDNR